MSRFLKKDVTSLVLFNLFPGGKQNCVTFSFDDGNAQDKDVAKMLSARKMKATFHLHNRTNMLLKDDFCEIYKDHEVACHGAKHVSINALSPSGKINEVMDNRRMLEGLLKSPVVGMSYALGDFCDEAVETLKACGILYSRTVINTGNFRLPQDFYRWNPTCHVSSAFDIAKKFMQNINEHFSTPRLFYIWAHTHEMDDLDHFESFKELIDLIDCPEKIWYATNIEIYRYLTAIKQLEVSADEKIIRNPTQVDVWFNCDGEAKVVRAGETVYL